MNNLVVVLQNGPVGVNADPARAVELYDRAADGGYVLAMENLANLLERGGEGVAPDLSRAMQLRSRALDVVLGRDVGTHVTRVVRH